MTAFADHHDLLVRYHRALIAHDSAALRELLTEEAAAQAAAASVPRLPLSDEITIDGFTLEGNGTLARVAYTDRGAGGELRLVACVSERPDGLRIAQPYPTPAD